MAVGEVRDPGEEGDARLAGWNKATPARLWRSEMRAERYSSVLNGSGLKAWLRSTFMRGAGGVVWPCGTALSSWTALFSARALRAARPDRRKARTWPREAHGPAPAGCRATRPDELYCAKCVRETLAAACRAPEDRPPCPCTPDRIGTCGSGRGAMRCTSGTGASGNVGGVAWTG
eukprot:scaffold12127_cov129-Isochrysis_galbana.AAC.3